MGKPALVVIAAMVLAGCNAIPRDPDGSLDRIRASRAFAVGLIAPGPSGQPAERQSALLTRIANRTAAEPRIEDGAAERLLEKLEDGELDLVVGELSTDTPWRGRVTMFRPLAEHVREHHTIALTVAARNGENAWIALVFEEIEAVTGGRR